MADSPNQIGLALRFSVTVDGQSIGLWSKCNGLTVTFGVCSFQSGDDNTTTHLPGRTSYETITLTRPVTPQASQALQKWLSQQANGTVNYTQSTITLLDASNNTVMTWTLQGVMPSKYTGPTFNSGATSVATEELQLTHQGFLAD